METSQTYAVQKNIDELKFIISLFLSIYFAALLGLSPQNYPPDHDSPHTRNGDSVA
jgi:hypothetical protein